MDQRMTEQKVERLKLVADGLRRIQEFESARYLDEYAAHLAQPSQAVDVVECDNCGSKDGCACARVGIGSGSHLCATCKQPVTLTRAIGNAQAEGWRELEAEARRLYNASVGDAHNLHCLAWSELSKDQQRKWISKASTTQATPNAHE